MNSFGVVDKEYTGRRVTQQGPIAANAPITLPIYISDKQQILVNIIKADGSTRLLTPNEYEYSNGSDSNIYLPTISIATGETVHIMFLGAVPYDLVSVSLTYQDIQNQIYTTATTSGTSTAYIATANSTSVRSYPSLSNARVLLTIHAGNSGVASTLNLNNLGAKSIKQLIGDGTKIDAFLPTGYKADVMYDGVDWVLLNPISLIAAPTGSVYTFAGATVPTGWLKCNGALLSRTTYAALFAVIGTTYGAGDGSTTFALPDLRGEFVRGFDDARGVDTGRALGSAQAGQNASHTHTASTSPAGGHNHSFTHTYRDTGSSGGWGSQYNGSPISLPGANGSTGTAVRWDVVSNVGDHTHAITVNADGGNESRPRNVAMHYIIKY